MSFTDRFIELPIKVYDISDSELTGKTEYEESFMKVNPMEISHYKPTYDGDEDREIKYVFVTLKNGDGFFVYLSIDAFERLLNAHLK